MINIDMVSETKIRDFFSRNLRMIEEGLSLVDTEYYLPNTEGAFGKIDILARDRFGHYVVIEIKKSNKTAREALHELHKYIALLRVKSGFGFNKVRCILLSTDWHELKVPFSSFVRTVDYHVQGYTVELDSEGVPISIEQVDLSSEIVTKKLCPIHIIFLSKNPFEKASLELDRIASHIGIKDYCLLKIDYAGNEPVVIYPYAQYLVLDVIDYGTQLEIEGRTDIEFSELSDEERANWGSEQLVQGYIMSIFSNSFDFGSSDVEVGHAEKFTSMLNTWKIDRIHRSGRFAESEKLIPDDDLIRDIKGLGGENPYIYQGISTPENRASWEEFVTKAQHSLMGNDYWRDGVNWFLDNVQSEMNKVTVSMYIYNPSNLIMYLYHCLAAKKFSYLPSLEIVVEDCNNHRVFILFGMLEWDRMTFPEDPNSILEEIFGDVFSFVISDLDPFQDVKQCLLMSRHGLSYELVQITIEEYHPHVLQYLTDDENDLWSFTELDTEKLSSFSDFIKQNQGYLNSLDSLIKTVTSYHDTFQ